MEKEIKPGDVVTLKSGGAAMTVNAINNGKLSCVWTLDDGKLETATLSVEAVKLKPATVRVPIV
ncbi:DUF2158 domain-containing protein [Pedobacter miscanthi]|uniref:DUF2158 domain-containing protein n=1 Tax=Pedobacter miscanthi TaxID=2259170 RepID=UPI00292DE154|nr:DUF2158 domain-containing protein [Pedobacter miscanthi]